MSISSNPLAGIPSSFFSSPFSGTASATQQSSDVQSFLGSLNSQSAQSNPLASSLGSNSLPEMLLMMLSMIMQMLSGQSASSASNGATNADSAPAAVSEPAVASSPVATSAPEVSAPDAGNAGSATAAASTPAVASSPVANSVPVDTNAEIAPLGFGGGLALQSNGSGAATATTFAQANPDPSYTRVVNADGSVTQTEHLSNNGPTEDETATTRTLANGDVQETLVQDWHTNNPNGNPGAAPGGVQVGTDPNDPILQTTRLITVNPITLQGTDQDLDANGNVVSSQSSGLFGGEDLTRNLQL